MGFAYSTCFSSTHSNLVQVVWKKEEGLHREKEDEGIVIRNIRNVDVRSRISSYHFNSQLLCDSDFSHI